MKKVISMVLIMVMVLSIIPVFATDQITVTIDGVPVQFEGQEPVIIDGRTLVPVRGVFEQLGFEVSWDSGAGRVHLHSNVSMNYGAGLVSLSNNINLIYIPLGSEIFYVNGVLQDLEVSAQNINGRVMLPLRAVLESVGCTLEWEASTRTVVITSSQSSEPIIFIPEPVVAEPEPVISIDRSAYPTNVQRGFYTQERILELIEMALPSSETRPSIRHPERRMTPEEAQVWANEYRYNGGLNQRELQALYDLNEIRVAKGLNPVEICHEASMGARLMAQLRTEVTRSEWGGRGFSDQTWGHIDPYYGGPSYRIREFYPNNRSFYGENIHTGYGNSRVSAFEMSYKHWMDLMEPALRVVGIGALGDSLVVVTLHVE